MSLDTGFRPQQVHPTVWLAPGATVVGDVTIGEDSSVWFGAVLRGDSETIRIGSRTNVQDGCILHADPGFPCLLGDGVTLGHGAIVHGAQVADNVMIGMRAVVMNGASIGANSIVGVGAVVTEGMQIPAGSLVLGLPAKIQRSLEPHEIERVAHAARHYVDRGREYRQSAARRGADDQRQAASGPG
jgi:carbonic anhydrase/acetyltransferase-like protein (isoleucine patch superfamily)